MLSTPQWPPVLPTACLAFLEHAFEYCEQQKIHHHSPQTEAVVENKGEKQICAKSKIIHCIKISNRIKHISTQSSHWGHMGRQKGAHSLPRFQKYCRIVLQLFNPHGCSVQWSSRNVYLIPSTHCFNDSQGSWDKVQSAWYDTHGSMWASPSRFPSSVCTWWLNFTCKLEWSKACLVKHFWVCLWGCWWKNWHLSP